MSYRALLLVALALAPMAAAAQGSRPPAVAEKGASNRTETRHLVVATDAEPVAAGADGRATLHVDLVPKPKMHVYAPEETRYLAVSLSLEANPRITVGQAVFPKAERFYFAPLEETQLVFSQPFRIAQPITVRRGGPARPIEVRGTLRYQACDDRVCYLPTDVPVRWTVEPR